MRTLPPFLSVKAAVDNTDWSGGKEGKEGREGGRERGEGGREGGKEGREGGREGRIQRGWRERGGGFN